MLGEYYFATAILIRVFWIFDRIEFSPGFFHPLAHFSLATTLRLLLAGWALVGWSACSSGPELETIESTDEQGLRIVYQRRVDNYAREGTFERFDAGGNRIELASYRSDSLHGTRVLFYPTGDTLSVETYQGGQFAGPYRAYFEDGTLRQQGQYVDNAMTGAWTSYYPSGDRREVVQMADNLEQGPFTEWYEGGALKAEGSYRDGDKEDGELRLYDSTGTLVRIMDCDLGMCFTRWRADSLQTTTE